MTAPSPPPPIVASWRPNGPDVEVEVGERYLIATARGGDTWGYEIVTVGPAKRGGDHDLTVGGWQFRYDWSDVAWFVPVAELSPRRSNVVTPAVTPPLDPVILDVAIVGAKVSIYSGWGGTNHISPSDARWYAAGLVAAADVAERATRERE